MAAQRIRHATSQRDAEAIRDEYVTLGYKIEADGAATFVAKKSTWGSLGGHLAVALLTVWWTIGLGNLVYALVVHKSDEVLVKVDTEATPAVA